ncbi:MAG: trypsin-like serine protease [Myxococcales bacterium]|nr:trypsin-like serine protease [Myxococcales bacterium]
MLCEVEGGTSASATSKDFGMKESAGEAFTCTSSSVQFPRDAYLVGSDGGANARPSLVARWPQIFNDGAPVKRVFVPMMDASGEVDSAQVVEVELVNFGRLERLSSASGDLSEVVKIARSTTVFISGRHGQQRWSGSGVIVDSADLPVQSEMYKAGAHFILTCQHVENDGGRLTVAMPDGKEYFAEVATAGNGAPLMDKVDDVALLVVYPKREYRKARLGFSREVEQGDPVVVSGHPLGLPRHTVTFGRISQNEAETGMVAPGLQTDAAINPGNSGGPMFNMKGEVIGISTYGYPGAENTACAQPIDVLRDDLVEVAVHGRKRRGYTGVNLAPFPLSDRYDVGFLEVNGFDDDTGAVVERVDPGSPADSYGILPGDIVVSIDTYSDGIMTESFDIDYQNSFESGKMQRIIMGVLPGNDVVYRIYRPDGTGFGREMEVRVPVEELNVEEYVQ